MGLGVPHPIPGLSYPSLIVPSESQGEIEALTEGVGGGERLPLKMTTTSSLIT